MFRHLEQLADEGELQYSWETEIVREQLHGMILDAAYAARVGRQLFSVVQLKAGHELKVTKETKNSVDFIKAAEGAEGIVDVEAYSQDTITPEKYFAIPVVSSEIREDANWDVIKRNIKACGIQAGLKEDANIVAAMADSTYGFYAGTSNAHRVTTSGTEIDVVDIVNAIRLPKTDDYYPNVMLIHPTQEAELNQIDTFVEADKVGSRVTFEKGFCGRIYGLDVIVSSSCTENYAYVLDQRWAGMLVVRRPLTTKTFEIPTRDSIGISVTFRQKAQVVQPNAGCDIVVS